MSKILGFIGMVLAIGGVGGLVHEWFGTGFLFGFVRRLAPDGQEFGFSIGCVVVGLVLLCAAGIAEKR